MYNFSDYDFIDLGTKNGGSIDFALRKLGGRKGLGIDITRKNVEAARKLGYDCIEGDATRLELKENSFRFIIMSHFLEHLTNLHTVEQVICNSAKIASDFLFIQGPFFDADSYLKQLDLKLYWSDWEGHPTHLRTCDLTKILRKNGLNRYMVRVKDRIVDSSDPAIHPLDSPQNQHAYISGQHPCKAAVKFTKPVFREMICYVPLNENSNWKMVYRSKRSLLKYFQSPLMQNRLMQYLNKRYLARLPF